MAEQSKKKPAAELRFGAIKVTVWENDTEHGPKFNTVLSRLYKDGRGKWQTTDSLGKDDLLTAAFALQRAYSWINHHQEQREAERRSA